MFVGSTLIWLPNRDLANPHPTARTHRQVWVQAKKRRRERAREKEKEREARKSVQQM